MPAVREPMMEGDLEHFPILDMLTWLHSSERTVTMRVSSGPESAWLMFRNGTLVYCDTGVAKGEAALLSLLRLERGKFWLSKSRAVLAEPNVHMPTGELLLHCTLALDEGRMTQHAC